MASSICHFLLTRALGLVQLRHPIRRRNRCDLHFSGLCEPFKFALVAEQITILPAKYLRCLNFLALIPAAMRAVENLNLSDLKGYKWGVQRAPRKEVQAGEPGTRENSEGQANGPQGSTGGGFRGLDSGLADGTEGRGFDSEDLSELSETLGDCRTRCILGNELTVWCSMGSHWTVRHGCVRTSWETLWLLEMLDKLYQYEDLVEVPNRREEFRICHCRQDSLSVDETGAGEAQHEAELWNQRDQCDGFVLVSTRTRTKKSS